MVRLSPELAGDLGSKTKEVYLWCCLVLGPEKQLMDEAMALGAWPHCSRAEALL